MTQTPPWAPFWLSFIPFIMLIPNSLHDLRRTSLLLCLSTPAAGRTTISAMLGPNSTLANKQVNLDIILKKSEAPTDEDHSFANFLGQYMKLIKEM